MQSKLKVRLGRHLGFEIHKPKEKVSVTQLKARIRQLETKVLQQQRYMRALVEGFTYIRDVSGRFYRFFNNGMAMDAEGNSYTVDWQNLRASGATASVALCANIDGSMREWVPDEQGKLVPCI